jgi:DNA-binding beta-propeller fold protein YncE
LTHWLLRTVLLLSLAVAGLHLDGKAVFAQAPQPAAEAQTQSAPAQAAPAQATPHVVFVQNDDPAGNTVVAYDRAPDGSLKVAGSYRTGGLGGVLDGSVVDHLASQGSLQLDREHGLLYAVNAGSNTITVFGVDGDRLIRRQVLPSFGDFPASIAVHDNLVYVLNARKGGSVQGYVRIGGFLVPIPAFHRALGLDPAATPEFTHTPGQVAFTPDGSRLLVTTKANTNAVQVFDVDRLGGLSSKPTTTTLAGAVPFAVAVAGAALVAVSSAAAITAAVSSASPAPGVSSRALRAMKPVS